MISILHPQTDEIVGWINTVITDSHQNSIKNEEIYNFTAPTSEAHLEYINKRSRIVIPSEEGDFLEFIVQSTYESTSGASKEVNTVASFVDLNKLKIIDPEVREGQTILQAATHALADIKDWKVGNVDHAVPFKWVIDAPIRCYDALKTLAELSKLELRFRITTEGEVVTGRYVDFIQRRGMDRGKEVVFGKDLTGITRRINSERIVTALEVYGPSGQSGRRLNVFVRNEAASLNWARDGQEIIDIYEPEVTGTVTLEKLTKLGEEELQKRLDAIIEYEVEAVALEHVMGYEHEAALMGDTVSIKDEYFSPPMYLNARVIFIDRSVFYKARKKYKIGEVIEYKKEDVMKVWYELQRIYGSKIIASDEPPVGNKDVLWIKTLNGQNIAHRWDTILEKWIGITGTVTWVMYAKDIHGLDMSEDATDRDYIGFAYNQTESTPSMNPEDYTWALFKGSDGIPGPTGEDGLPTYTWVKYAMSIDGAYLDDDPVDKEYIGFAYNKPTKLESLDPADYTWALFKGPKGEDAWHVEVISSRGNIFKAANINTLLEAKVYKGGVDVTDDLPASKFKWKRVSDDPVSDTVWNDRYFSGVKSIIVTTNDVHRRATFFCDIIK